MIKSKIIILMLIICTLVSSVNVCVYANEGTTPMYDLKGNVAYVPDSQIEAHLALGWLLEVVIPMYDIDGNVVYVPSSQAEAHHRLGWYYERLVKMYDIYGNMAYVPDSQTQAHNKLGWYYAPVMKMYSPDGSSTVIAQSDIWTYKGMGWYEYPVTTVYDSVCSAKVIPSTELSYWLGKGWYQTNWRKAYADILYNILYSEENYSDLAFNFVYIDNDTVPELLVSEGWYHAAAAKVYSYKNGMVHKQYYYNEQGYCDKFGSFGDISYIPGSGLIISSYMQSGWYSMSVYSLSIGGACMEVFSAESYDGFWETTYYKINNNFVSSYTFENSCKKYSSRGSEGLGSNYYYLNYSNIKAATWY